jgi:hypothetical protein
VELLEPFERLEAALARRDDGPTAAEIQAFVKSRDDNPDAEMQEFILLLKSLNKPAEERERKAARRKARSQLHRMMESYRVLCWQLARQAEKVRSSENLAALMAPRDQNALLMQRMEDSNLRQLWRLTNTLIKVRKGALTKKDVKNEDRSDYVYENKGEYDKMSSEKQAILQEDTTIEA